MFVPKFTEVNLQRYKDGWREGGEGSGERRIGRDREANYEEILESLESVPAAHKAGLDGTQL